MEASLPGLEIQEILAEGPVEREYKARQLPLGRLVRVVMLSSGLSSSSVLAAPLRREAEALARLDHPNVVRLYDFRDDGQRLYRVEELVVGPRLSALSSRQLSFPAAAAVGHAVALALSHAHSRGIVHGRLGAERITITLDGLVKVAGFSAHPKREEDVEPIETESFDGLSPEVTVGQSPTPASDLFALGALLYLMLTGRHPFGDATAPSYPAKVRNESPPPLLRLRPDTPTALKQLVERCLQKLPADRPSDATTVATSLAAFCSSPPENALVQELAERGLTSAPGSVSSPPQKSSRKTTSSWIWLLLPLGIAVGAALTAAITLPTEQQPRENSRHTLETRVASQSILLRVVATPWAHVLVDGAHLETTPFAQPLLLAPGHHLVRLEHPFAPPEERAIEGRAGQAILLDVRMQVEPPMGTQLPDVEEREDSP